MGGTISTIAAIFVITPTYLAIQTHTFFGLIIIAFSNIFCCVCNTTLSYGHCSPCHIWKSITKASLGVTVYYMLPLNLKITYGLFVCYMRHFLLNISRGGQNLDRQKHNLERFQYPNYYSCRFCTHNNLWATLDIFNKRKIIWYSKCIIV